MTKNNMSHHSVPSVFLPALRCSNVRESHFFNWWRAQSSAFIVLLNKDTATQVQHLRGKILSHVPSPLPSGTVKVHVRHGDKGLESKVFAFPAYLERANSIGGTEHKMFLSTEDAAVVTEANRLPNWTVWYAKVLRPNVVSHTKLN